MTPSDQGDGTVQVRVETDAFELSDAFRSTCDRVCQTLGWRVSLLLRDDEATGLLCLVSASGLPNDLLEILIGAGVADTSAVSNWFTTHSPSPGAAVALDQLGAHSPFALDGIAGDALADGDPSGNAVVAPLLVRGRVVGALAAYGPGPVDNDRLRLLELVAAGAAELVDQSASAERSRRRSESGQLLVRLANRIYRLRNADEILDITVHDLCSHLELPMSAVFRVADGLVELAQEAAAPDTALRAASLDVAPHVGRAVEQGAAVATVATPDGRDAQILFVPIFIRDELTALLACATPSDGRAWLPHEIELVRGVADQLGVALSEARLIADQESARRDLECLLAGSQALAQADDLDTVVSEILCVTEQVVGPRACAVLLLDDSREQLVVRAHRGCDEGVASVVVPVAGPSVAAEAVRTRAAVAAQNGAASHERFVLKQGASCALAVPLVLGETLLGALVVEATQPRIFGARETRLAVALAHETAVAIHRTQLFDKVALGKREWEATFDAMEDPVFLLDRDGRILRANRAAARAHGREPKAILGANCCAIVCSRGGADGCATRAAVESGEPAHREVRLDGADYMVSASPIRNRAGAITGAVTVLRRRAAAVAVDEIDVHVAVALGRSRQPVLLLDRGRSAQWANDAAERLYGDALVPFAHITSLVDPADADRVAEAIARVSEGSSDPVDVRLRATGREVELFFSASQLADGEDVVLVLARDVEAEPSHGSAVASRARLAGAIAAALTRHGIAGLARLERDAEAEPGAAVASYVSREAALLDRLDRFSRSRLDRVVEPLELNRIVESAIELLRPRFEGDARERGVAYDVRFEPCRSARALGNANELRDSFVELIANALEAQPAGGRVEIKTIERAGIVGVRVRDAGDGMADDVRARVFDPLFTTKGGRLGLGLSFAHGAVLRHGGRLSVRCTPGEGSSFQIVLPAFEGAGEGDDVGAPRADALLLVPDRLRRLRLLDQLEDAGVSAVWASDTREVVWALDLHKPRALVLDRGAFFDHGDRLIAIVRSTPEQIAVLVVATELPEPAAFLASRPNVRLVTIDEVARLVR